MLQTTLDNGLKVILVEDHSAPVVALNVWVRAGSADERPEQWGMAHVHEHMLFKGTQQFGVGEIAATVEGAGGNINAFTSLRHDRLPHHDGEPRRVGRRRRAGRRRAALDLRRDRARQGGRGRHRGDQALGRLAGQPGLEGDLRDRLPDPSRTAAK